jgi:L-fuculose-phosphate aldolase
VSYPGARPPATAEDAVRQVVLACRIIARFGQEDLTLGHASVRGPDGRTVYIKRKGKALRDVRSEDVIDIALDDPDGYLTPGAHLETIMHLETYLARPDVGAVIHTHPMYSIALGATVGGLELLSHDGLLFPDGVPVFDGTAGLVTTPQDGQGVARALGSGRAVLLRNHGILAAGEDVSWAVLTALTLERAARIQFIARTLGETVPVASDVARDPNLRRSGLGARSISASLPPSEPAGEPACSSFVRSANLVSFLFDRLSPVARSESRVRSSLPLILLSSLERSD